MRKPPTFVRARAGLEETPFPRACVPSLLLLVVCKAGPKRSTQMHDIHNLPYTSTSTLFFFFFFDFLPTLPTHPEAKSLAFSLLRSLTRNRSVRYSFTRVRESGPGRMLGGGMDGWMENTRQPFLAQPESRVGMWRSLSRTAQEKPKRQISHVDVRRAEQRVMLEGLGVCYVAMSLSLLPVWRLGTASNGLIKNSFATHKEFIHDS